MKLIFPKRTVVEYGVFRLGLLPENYDQLYTDVANSDTANEILIIEDFVHIAQQVSSQQVSVTLFRPRPAMVTPHNLGNPALNPDFHPTNVGPP
jgi:hypothetical protein